MINHLRTLLLNVSGSFASSAALGAEYVPTSYVAVNLPQSITAVRRLLFGSAPDQAMLNYRARQLLTILHATDLKSFVYELDSRITYKPADDTTFANVRFGLSATRPVTVSTDLMFTGSESLTAEEGKLDQSWSVQYDDTGSGPQLTISRASADPLTAVTDVVFTDGLSDEHSLVGSGWFVRIHEAATYGSYWAVTNRRRPRSSLLNVAQSVQALPASTVDALFGGVANGTNTEPFLTFRNLWNDHGEFPYKIGALALALGYTTEYLRAR